MLFHIRRSPDGDGGGGDPTPPEPAGATNPEDTLEHWRGRAESHHRDLTAMKAQLTELTEFKTAADAATAKARDADLAAKGEYETLAAEKDARIVALEAKVAESEKADKARADVAKAKVEQMLTGRTDADELRGKLVRIVGDDPHKQLDLIQELTGASAATAPPDTQTPNGNGSDGNGLAALTTEELDKCRLVCGQMGRTFEEQCKWLQEQKARLASTANPWAAENAAEAARQGGV